MIIKYGVPGNYRQVNKGLAADEDQKRPGKNS